MKAIETIYKGYKFRSRLEARWAVFLDAMGAKWIYEPEGFILPNGMMYLPDFYLPDINTWIEIKGISTTKDQDKIHEFYSSDNEHVSHRIIMLGDIPEEGIDIFDWYRKRYPHQDNFMLGFWDTPYFPCVCPKCGKLGFEFDGRGARICRGSCGYDKSDDKGYTYDNPKILAAYRIARQARFEHGETPIIAQVVESTNDNNEEKITNLINDIRALSLKEINLNSEAVSKEVKLVDKYPQLEAILKKYE